jgi:hypothetical protein
MKKAGLKKTVRVSRNHRDSDLGRKLRKIAENYEAKGGRPLSRQEIEREVARRRGAA